MFSVGDTVVYRHHVCTIACVREAYFDEKDYFELHTLFEKSLKLYVAIEDAKEPLMRSVMSTDEALALIDFVPTAPFIDEAVLHANATTMSLAERQIKEEYERRLKTSDAYDLVPVVKSTHKRTVERESSGRHVTAIDKKYHDLAKSLLFDELAVALDFDRDAVEDFVRNRLGDAGEW